MIVHPSVLRPKRSVLLIASAALLTLGGCVNFAGIKSDHHIEAPSKYEASESLPAEGGKWPSLDWSEQFGDPQLPRLIDEALKGNPDIDEARARIDKATSYVGNANSKLYPTVDARYSWTRELNTENTVYPPSIGGAWNSENTVMEGASWDLDLWGKNHERLRQATSDEKVAQAEMEEVRITLAASVASTYNELARLYRLREIAAQELRNREEIGRITNGRVVAGLDTNVEKQTATGDIATTR
ncbi:TolC family protein, partial [Paraburkholderia sp. GAS348]|uniref:TolC family protein n=1 Tax=Paraburkholderia sp. GAS348 TaxID=3035132 RepID=UPI003D20F86A